MTGWRVPVAAGLAGVLLTLVGCGAPGDGRAGVRAERAGAGSPAETAAAARQPRVGPCPDLPRQRPRGDGLPALRLPCLGSGPAVRLSDLRGVPTVLNVWAAWCTTCDREMPLFAKAMSRYGEQLRFFGVHYKAPREAGLASEGDFGVPFPSVHDEDGDRVVRELDAFAPPQTYFVTADGLLAGRKIGEITSDRELDGLVRRYLGVRP